MHFQKKREIDVYSSFINLFKHPKILGAYNLRLPVTLVSEIQIHPSKNLKIIVAGEGGVGKTTMIESSRVGHFFGKTTMTIAVQFHTMVLEGSNQIFNLQIWDLGGQNQFYNIGLFDRYCNGAHGALLCFDIRDLDSLQEVPKWVDLIPPSIPKILVATKADMATDAELTDIQDIVMPYLKNLNFDAFMTSDVRNIISVQNIFRYLVVLAHNGNDAKDRTKLFPSLIVPKVVY